MRLVGATAVFRVDDEDYARVLAKRWFVGDRGYLQSTDGIKLHRWLLDAQRGEEIDHINRDKMDNRKANLRRCTRAENCWNAAPRRSTYSQYKGVTWDKRLSLWRSEIACKGKKYRSPRLRDEKEAAAWYDSMAKKLHGEFAYINLKEDYAQ